MSKYLENEFSELEKFERISVEKDDMDLGKNDEQASVFKKFSLETRGGRKFYHSLKNEQLICLKKRSRKIRTFSGSGRNFLGVAFLYKEAI